MNGDDIEAFQASLQRCLESPSFIKDFYDRFLGSSDAIRAQFHGTDFERQNRALADSLYMIAVAAQGGPDNIARRAMERLAQRHKEMGITASMYDLWLDCLLGAARVYDPKFSDALERAWRATLVPGIEYMRAGVPFGT